MTAKQTTHTEGLHILLPLVDKSGIRVNYTLDEIKKALVLSTGCTWQQAHEAVDDVARFSTWFDPQMLFTSCTLHIRSQEEGKRYLAAEQAAWKAEEEADARLAAYEQSLEDGTLAEQAYWDSCENNSDEEVVS